MFCLVTFPSRLRFRCVPTECRIRGADIRVCIFGLNFYSLGRVSACGLIGHTRAGLHFRADLIQFGSCFGLLPNRNTLAGLLHFRADLLQSGSCLERKK